MTAKRMFVRILRSTLAEYAEDGSEEAVDSELLDLHRALTRGKGSPRAPRPGSCF